jgi:hypothetical protein
MSRSGTERQCLRRSRPWSAAGGGAVERAPAVSFAKASSLFLTLELLLVLQHACAAAAELRRRQLGRARPRIRALREGERNESGVQRWRLRNILLERRHHRGLRDGPSRPDGCPDRAARRTGIHRDRAGIWILRYAHWGGHIPPVPVVLSQGGPFDSNQCGQGGGGQGNCCFRRHASYVSAAGRPAKTMPRQWCTRSQTIYLKTAKALGLTIPDTLLARAHEVIEQRSILRGAGVSSWHD